MDLSRLKMTIRAYQKVTKSILDDYAKKSDLEGFVAEAPNDNKVYSRKNKAWVEGIEDVSTTAPTDKQYARKRGEWVEVESTYNRPKFLVCEFIGLQPSYDIGTSITLSALKHQESNLVHIAEQKIKLSVKIDDATEFTPITTLDASAEITQDFVGYTMTLNQSAVFRAEMETDIGNFYHVDYTVTGVQAALFMDSVNNKTAVTATDLATFTSKAFSESSMYRYTLTAPSYIWWASSFDIASIKQDGLYNIDYVKQDGTITYQGMDMRCYRTTEQLETGAWKFQLAKDTPTPPPGPEPENADLRLGGSLEEVMTEDEMEGLTGYVLEENKVYSVNLLIDAYVWVCCQHEIEIMDSSGVAADFTQHDNITYKEKTYYCYRSNEQLSSGTWGFKFAKL